MRVLYITAEVPYPLTSGYLRHYHILRGLSARHDVTLLSLTRRPEVSPEAAAVLGEFLSELEVVAPTGEGLYRLASAVGELHASCVDPLKPGDGVAVMARNQVGTSTARASSVAGEPINTGGGMSRPRPLAPTRRWTASAENASAASP